jgi:hypothetical protein
LLFLIFFIFEHGSAVRANRVAFLHQAVTDFASKHVFFDSLFAYFLCFSIP